MSKKLSTAALFTLSTVEVLALFAAEIPAAYAVPASRLGEAQPQREGTCDAPVRRFRSGPGRQPGALAVVIQMRQTILNAGGEFVPASSLATRAHVLGNAAVIRIAVRNRSIYDVSDVILRHRFRPAPEGPQAEGIASVVGAVYSDREQVFVIPRIAAGGEGSFTFRILLHGDLAAGVSQSKMTLEDFTILDSSSRYPLPTSLTPDGRSRMNVERIGLGAVEVSCFSGAEALRSGMEREEGGTPVKAEEAEPETLSFAPPAPAAGVLESVVMPQTGAGMMKTFLVALQVVLGMLIGAGLFWTGMWLVLRRL